MSILTRMVRHFQADIHGLMDEVQDRDLLLRQHLREMAEVLEERETTLHRLRTRRRRMNDDAARLREEMDRLDADVTAAVEKDRDDIARFLLRKLASRQALHADLVRRLESLDRDLESRTRSLNDRKSTYENLRLRAETLAGLRMAGDREGETGDRDARFDDPFRGTEREGTGEEEIELALLRRKDAVLRSRDAGASGSMPHGAADIHDTHDTHDITDTRDTRDSIATKGGRS